MKVRLFRLGLLLGTLLMVVEALGAARKFI
jgi:hypothetical protein